MRKPILAASIGALLFLGSCGTSHGPSQAAKSATSTTTTQASVPVPALEGPIEPSSKISLLGSTLFPLSEVGYEQSEFFLSGTATAYTDSKPLTSNGDWQVTPEAKAYYKTRIVVYRPVDASRFDGTVMVEWFNVTGGISTAATWLTAHIQMIRSGMAYVGVDAQAGGIYGEAGSLASHEGAGGIKVTDPSRYGSLVQPGDSFSYSIFEQAGKAVHADAGRILGGLRPLHVIAAGESQSAFRMVTYIDAIQPISVGIYDGYLVYSRGGDSADLSQAPLRTIATPTPTYIRTDLDVPVLMFETEADVIGLGYRVARQAPTRFIREWEVAGTAHDDTYGLLYARSDTGNGSADTEAFASMLDPPSAPIPGIVVCPAPINTGSHTYEIRAAVQALVDWVATGVAPPQSPRLEVDPSDPSRFLLDADGEALGGVRTPQVQVPVAILSGVGQPGSTPIEDPGRISGAVSGSALCGIFGTTVTFGAAKLAALYPSHEVFVQRWDAATAADVKEGYLLAPDAVTLDRVAAASRVGDP